jgi:hypothetical protein
MTNASYRQGGIFSSGPSDEPHSYVGINRGENAFGLYAGGFFDAAEQLAQSMLQNRGKVDLNIYPLIYLYRHGTELALKQLCRYYDEIFRGDPTSETQRGHSLSTLCPLYPDQAPDPTGSSAIQATNSGGPHIWI